MSKATDKHTQATFERTRAKLKAREAELITAERSLKMEREAFRKERADLVALLQVLTEQYGRSDWTSETPLALVIERYLLDPIMLQVSRLREARRRETQPSPPEAETAPAPAPARPRKPRILQAVPEIIHRVMVVEAQDKQGRRGSSCRCTCGWYSFIFSTAAEAWREARAHEADPTTQTRMPAAQ